MRVEAQKLSCMFGKMTRFRDGLGKGVAHEGEKARG